MSLFFFFAENNIFKIILMVQHLVIGWMVSAMPPPPPIICSCNFSERVGSHKFSTQRLSCNSYYCVLSWYTSPKCNPSSWTDCNAGRDRPRREYLFLDDETRLCVLWVWRFLWLQSVCVYLGVREQSVLTRRFAAIVNHNIVEVRATTWRLRNRAVLFLNLFINRLVLIIDLNATSDTFSCCCN